MIVLWHRLSLVQLPAGLDFMGDTARSRSRMPGRPRRGNQPISCSALFGGLFVVEAVSVIVQVVSFQGHRQALFKDGAAASSLVRQKGAWDRAAILIRFWIISVVLALRGLSR